MILDGMPSQKEASLPSGKAVKLVPRTVSVKVSPCSPHRHSSTNKIKGGDGTHNSISVRHHNTRDIMIFHSTKKPVRVHIPSDTNDRLCRYGAGSNLFASVCEGGLRYLAPQ